MNHSDALESVDEALGAARRGAADVELPPALRARILASTRRTAPSSPGGRVIDFVVRGAAVAASIVAVALVMPLPIEAAEFDAAPFVEWNARVGETVANRLSPVDVTDAALTAVDPAPAWALAAAAVVLLGAGLRLARRERGR